MVNVQMPEAIDLARGPVDLDLFEAIIAQAEMDTRV